jgi:hypothetical protein
MAPSRWFRDVAAASIARIDAGLRNPPPFTLRLLEGFVNGKIGISTGFYRFSSVFFGF